MRLIDADALEELFREVISGIAKRPDMNGNMEHMIRASAMVIEMIKDAPTIEPERKTGKWIKLDMHAHLADHKCTACGQECYVPTCMGEPLYAYCPNCGAKMEGRE